MAMADANNTHALSSCIASHGDLMSNDLMG